MSEIEEERPDFLLEKFATPEDQARAYAEAEREMQRMRSQMEQERAQFTDALQNIEQLRTQEEQRAPIPQQPYNPDNDPLLAQYQQALDMGDARAILAINLELNRQMAAEAVRTGLKDITGQVQQNVEMGREQAITMATERVQKRYGEEEWQNMAPEIARVLQDNVEWIPSQSSVEAYEKAINQAARLVEADRVLAERGRADQVRQEKLNTQGLTGDSSRIGIVEGSDKEWEAVKNAQLTGYAGILRGSG